MILNIHGILDQGNNRTARFLEHLFPCEDILSPDLPLEPVKVVEELDEQIHRYGKTPLMIVGESLGGFYAYIMCAILNVPAVFLNPAIVPFITSTDLIGPVRNKFTGEKGEWKFQYVLQLKKLFCEHAWKADPRNLNVFVCLDDRRLDHNLLTRKFFVDFSKFISFEEGGHRFDNLERISDTLSVIMSETEKGRNR